MRRLLISMIMHIYLSLPRHLRKLISNTAPSTWAAAFSAAPPPPPPVFFFLRAAAAADLLDLARFNLERGVLALADFRLRNTNTPELKRINN